MKLLLTVLSVGLLCLHQGATVRVSVSVMEGDLVTLNTGVQTNQQENIKWYYNNTLMVQITGNQSKICTDVQCNGGDKRFRDRLKLDHQTGSLTIMNITNTDAGEYELQINRDENTFKVFVHGAEREEVKKKEGESVTLDPGVINNANDGMMWYFNETLIAENTGDPNKTCTDNQCNERFRDRLYLDPQTGSLTIMNIRTKDSGKYRLSKHISISISINGRRRRSISSNAKRFDVTITDQSDRFTHSNDGLSSSDPASGPSSSDPGLGPLLYNPGSGPSTGQEYFGLFGVLVMVVAVGLIYKIFQNRGYKKQPGKNKPDLLKKFPKNVDVKEQPRYPEESLMNE